MMSKLACLALLLAASGAFAGEWERLAPLPNKDGVAGAFAGVSGGALLVGGGANFPDKKPWEGGTKRWYDTVYALDRPDGAWRTIGKLPRPLGYGVSVTHRSGVIVVGGNDADRCYADAFRLEIKAGSLVTTALPPLPRPISNACGALLGDTLYVACGQERPDVKEALRTCYTLDLGAPDAHWREIEACPGVPRILAAAASFDGAFWLIGGAELAAAIDGKVERHYLHDAWRYDPGHGWTRAPDLPRPVVAAPSPAPCDDSGFFLLGGDDGTHLGFTPPENHPGFNATILHFDRPSGRWMQAGEMPAARVTTPLVEWNNAWVIPSGEARPGVRSPEIWRCKPGKRE